MICGKFGESFGSGNGVGTEKNGCGSIEERIESVGQLFGFVFESQAEKIVFGDEETGVGFLGFGTEKILFGDRETGVLGEDDGFGIS